MPRIAQDFGGRKTSSSANGDPISAWDMVETIQMLLFGDSGTGKTTLWATFPGPIFAAICSGSNRPGELRSINTPEYRKKIKPVVIESIDQYCEELEKAAGKYETFVLDHVTGLLGLQVKEFLNLKDIPAVKKFMMASQIQWGQINEKVIGMLRETLNFAGNVVIVGQERIFGGKDEVGGADDIIRPKVSVALTPGIANWLRPACDYVVQTYIRPKMERTTSTVAGKTVTNEKRVKGVEYCLRTEPHDTYTTKFRVTREITLPECIVDPTYDKIMSVIRGE